MKKTKRINWKKHAETLGEEASKLRNSEYDLKRDLETSEDKVYDLKDKSMWKNIAIGCLLAVIVFGGLGTYGLTKDVDEDKFCLDKLNAYFPEYKFTDAYYHGEWTSEPFCRGYFNVKIEAERRDGLEERGKVVRESKEYNLIMEEDLIYLESDDHTTFWSAVALSITVICALVSLIIIVGLFTEWLDL